MTDTSQKPSRFRGFTLVELVIVMAIAAISLALAVPAYQNTIEKRQTTAKAEELAAFLASAQGEAVKMNKLVSVALNYTDADNWCVGANEGDAPCDCTETVTTEADYCSLNEVAAVLGSNTYARSNLSAKSADSTFVFDPIRGTLVSGDLAAPHGFEVSSDNGNWSLQVGVGATGRVKVCNPDPAKQVSGFKTCTGSI